MTATSLFCRTQQALHHERAATAPLANIRAIAKTAAAAWGREATLAEQRERRAFDRALPTAGSLSEQREDSWFSENPDRGMGESVEIPRVDH